MRRVRSDAVRPGDGGDAAAGGSSAAVGRRTGRRTTGASRPGVLPRRGIARMRHVRSQLLTTLVLALVVATAGAGSAYGATAYEYAGGFGSNSEFTNPQRMAVHQQTGNLFVVDRGGNRVLVYRSLYPDPPGSGPLLERLGEIDASDLLVGENLNAPASIAIDQESGDIFVSKTGAPAKVLKIHQTVGDPEDLPTFTQDAAFVSPEVGAGANQVGSLGIDLGVGGSLRGGLAIGVDSFTDDPILLVGDPQKNVIHSYSLSGTRVDAFVHNLVAVLKQSTFNGRIAGAPADVPAFQSLQDVRTDSQGNLVVADIGTTNNRVDRYDPSGAHSARFSELDNPQPASTGIQIAADGVTDEVFATNRATVTSAPTISQFETASPRATIGPVSQIGGYVASMVVTSNVESGPEGRIYVASSAALLGGTQRSIQIFRRTGELPDPPTVSIETPDQESDVGADYIDVRANINPNGAQNVLWWVEYRRCPGGGSCSGSWSSGAQQGPLSGSSGEAVSFRLPGLEANMHYELRVVARNEFNDRTESDTPNPVAKTLQVAPSVSTSPTASIGLHQVTLVGSVNSHNTDSSWYFEVEKDGQPLKALPDPAAGIAAGTTAVQVTAELPGLEAGSEYRYRILAENEAEMVSEGDWVTFQTRPRSDGFLLEDRGYERVSQADNNGIRVSPGVGSEDGDHNEYRAVIPMPGAENGGNFSRRSSRNPDGTWSQDRYQVAIPPDSQGGGVQGQQPLFPERSGDMSTVALVSAAAHDPADTNGVGDIYLRNLDTGSMTWVSRGGDSSDTREPTLGNGWLSADGSKLVFQSSRPLLTGTPANALYLWDQGTLSQVSPGAAELGEGNAVDRGAAVSADGSRAIFKSSVPGADNGRLFLWDRGAGVGAVTRLDAAAANFVGADAALEHVAYRRGGQLWVWDAASGSSSSITQGQIGGATVEGVLAAATDIGRIYFVSRIDDSTWDIWLAERDEGTGEYAVESIARVDPGLSFSFNNWLPNGVYIRQATTNNSGSVFAFRAVSANVPGRQTAGYGQVYVYERGRDSLYCVSCPSDGSEPSGHASLLGADHPDAERASTTMGQASIGAGGFAGSQTPRARSISEDGTVVFQTPSRLLVGDSNSALDVYEWRGGETKLVTQGRGSAESRLAGVSTDGRTIFFSTAANPVPDGNLAGMSSLFAARAGGGYVPKPSPAVCRGSECRDHGGQPPRREPLGSNTSGVERSSKRQATRAPARCAGPRSAVRRAQGRVRQSTRRVRLAQRRGTAKAERRARRGQQKARKQLRGARRALKSCQARARAAK